MPPACGGKGGTQYQRGDLRLEETIRRADDRLSDRSVAGWPFLAIAAGSVERGDFSILWRLCIESPSQPKLASSLPNKRLSYWRLTGSTRNDGGGGVPRPSSDVCHLTSEFKPQISFLQKSGPFSGCRFFVSDVIVGFIPFRKFPEAFAEGGGGAVAVVFFQGFCVRIGDGDVAGLHGYQFLVGFEVVVFGENTGAEEFLLEDVYEAEEVFRPSAADVIYGVGWEGKAVFAVFLFRRSLHDADDAFHNVIDVGEIPFAVAVVEDLDGAAGPQFIGESEVGHVRPSGRAVDGEEAEACGGNVVEFGIAVGQEFVRFLGSRIEGDGMVHFVIGAEGDFCISAIHGGGGGIH